MPPNLPKPENHPLVAQASAKTAHLCNRSAKSNTNNISERVGNSVIESATKKAQKKKRKTLFGDALQRP